MEWSKNLDWQFLYSDRLIFSEITLLLQVVYKSCKSSLPPWSKKSNQSGLFCMNLENLTASAETPPLLSTAWCCYFVSFIEKKELTISFIFFISSSLIFPPVPSLSAAPELRWAWRRVVGLSPLREPLRLSHLLAYWNSSLAAAGSYSTLPISALQHRASLQGIFSLPRESRRDWCLTTVETVHPGLLRWLLSILLHFSHNEVSAGFGSDRQRLSAGGRRLMSGSSFSPATVQPSRSGSWWWKPKYSLHGYLKFFRSARCE